MTPEQLAQAMVDQMNAAGRRLPQTAAVRVIRAAGHEDQLYKNKQRNWAIQAPILTAFNKLTGDDVVWSRSQQLWRKRRPTDKPGRLQR